MQNLESYLQAKEERRARKIKRKELLDRMASTTSWCMDNEPEITEPKKASSTKKSIPVEKFPPANAYAPPGSYSWALNELEVSAGHSFDHIRGQFKTKALNYHPDKPGGCVEKMRVLNEAWAIIQRFHPR